MLPTPAAWFEHEYAGSDAQVLINFRRETLIQRVRLSLSQGSSLASSACITKSVKSQIKLKHPGSRILHIDVEMVASELFYQVLQANVMQPTVFHHLLAWSLDLKTEPQPLHPGQRGRAGVLVWPVGGVLRWAWLVSIRNRPFWTECLHVRLWMV